MKNIHVLPTDKPSRLLIDTIENKLYYQPILHNKTVNVLTQHIYITSDEEIKAKDWIISKSTSELIKSSKSYCANNEYGKKIILTTDQELIKDGVQEIDDEFLEWFVKNPSCESVDINRDWGYPSIIIPKEEPNKTHYLDEIPNTNKEVVLKMFEAAIPKLEPKQRAKNYMRLKGALEPKQESLEEAAKQYAKQYALSTRHISHIGFEDGAKWQAERMYSESDKIMKFLDTEIKLGLSDIKTIERVKWYFETYFEQFKKK